jgi:hypothetical protein
LEGVFSPLMNPRFGTYMFLDMSSDAVVILGPCQSPFYGDAHCVRSLSNPQGSVWYP